MSCCGAVCSTWCTALPHSWNLPIPFRGEETHALDSSAGHFIKYATLHSGGVSKPERRSKELLRAFFCQSTPAGTKVLLG